jgi:predicted nucleotidyltransferase
MYPLTYEESFRIFKRRWSRGLFRGTMFSVHPVKLEEEVSEKFGDRIFKPEGLVKIEATVTDASEAEFLPAIYRVKDAEILKGQKVKDILEVASYEGLYGGLAEEGERIIANGKLEEVTDRRIGQRYHRVLVGSKEGEGKDYVKPL